MPKLAQPQKFHARRWQLILILLHPLLRRALERAFFGARVLVAEAVPHTAYAPGERCELVKVGALVLARLVERPVAVESLIERLQARCEPLLRAGLHVCRVEASAVFFEEGCLTTGRGKDRIPIGLPFSKGKDGPYNQDD